MPAISVGAYRLGPDGEPWRANDKSLLPQPETHTGTIDIHGCLWCIDGSGPLFRRHKTGHGRAHKRIQNGGCQRIENAVITQKKVLQTVELQFDYDRTDKVMKAIQDTEAAITEQNYRQLCPAG